MRTLRLIAAVMSVCVACLFTGGVLLGEDKPPEADSASPKDAASWTTDPVSQMVFFAVLEGLYSDGVTNDIIDFIIPQKPATKKPDYTASFIYTCPLCEPTLEAMRVYGARPVFLGFRPPAPNTFGPGVDEHTREQLASPARGEREEALQRLLEKWVRRRMDTMRLTDAERAEWQGKFEAGRKAGLERLKEFQEKGSFGGTYTEWKRCAACDGIVAACGGGR
ncbi:MAG: hypothetical protein HZB26_06670 [Candidatus Hydrogenedentes bacterium]|nr:hypothetical protein [Candidatus Hydrogenedentota bacterium]